MEMRTPKPGDRYLWSDCKITVSRVAADGTWADVRVLQEDTGATWTKRMQLPLGDDFVRVTPSPVTKQQCKGCGAEEVELGFAYCMDCVDVLLLKHGRGETDP